MLRSYTAADVFTIGNAACGTISICLCLEYLATDVRRFLWIAFLLLPLALPLDVCDGYVARLNPRRQSILGADLDSLSDVISFGVAFWQGRIEDTLWFGATRIGPAWLHPLSLVFAASGSAMISGTLRVPKP